MKNVIACKKSFLLLILIATSYLIWSFITSPLQQLTPTTTLPKHNNDGDYDMKDLVRVVPATFLDSDRGKLTGFKSSLVHTGCPVEELINRCMKATNLGRENLSKAQNNARYLYNELRRTIPPKALSDYSSHCWNVSYFAQWVDQPHNGHIGNITFKIGKLPRLIIPLLTRTFPAKKFKFDKVCLPNLFLADFPKCGSSFLFCLITKLLYKTTTYNFMPLKEPHFWVGINPVKNVHVPKVYNLGKYILNFQPWFKNSRDRSKPMLIDGTPNLIFDWPRFRRSERDLTNYCIMPSVLPNILPDSKYIAIMRDPIDMLYSTFWFSCTRLTAQFPIEVQLKGPLLFHHRVKKKITMFNNCMKDSSVPLLNHICNMGSKHSYSACITKRLHLLDKCVHKITFNLFSPKLDYCGRSRVSLGIYFVHVRKWLSVVAKDRFLFLTLEDIVKNTTQGMLDVLKYIGLKTSDDYKISADVARSSCGTNSQANVNYKHDHRLQMRANTRTLLEIFYHPFNILLSELLNRTTLWNK